MFPVRRLLLNQFRRPGGAALWPCGQKRHVQTCGGDAVPLMLAVIFNPGSACQIRFVRLIILFFSPGTDKSTASLV